MKRRSFLFSIISAAIVLVASVAMADLRDYAPANVTVTTTSGTVLSADNRMKTVTLTNIGTNPVWLCHSGQTAVVNKGWYLPANASITFDGDSVPLQGLNGIAVGGSSTVAIAKG